MPEETVEIADDASAEDLAWIAEEEAKAVDTEKKIESGEIPQEAVAGWTSDNWQTKASGAAPEDIDV